MAITKQQKSEQLLEITNQMQGAKSIVFAQYAWISVNNVRLVKTKLREAWVSFKVIKKTLIKIAAKNLFWVEIDDNNLEWQIAVICSNNDIVSWPKIIKAEWKKFKSLKLLWWIFEWKSLSQSDTLELANLPSREELISKLLWSFMAPIQWFYGVNKWVLSGFARVLNAHKENLEKQGA